MAGFNPCLCWNLKDGCVTVGIWSLMGIFGWQTAAIKFYKDRASNNLLPQYGVYDTYDNRYPGYYERYYESTEERFYTGLFVIQILILIAAFFLLFASVGLIYGIHTNSRYLVWPWFPCIVVSCLCSIAYCVMWWVGTVTGYWVVLTIIEIITVIINVYCLLCVIVQYRRIVRGVADPFDYYREDQKNTMVYYDPAERGGGMTTVSHLGTPLPEKTQGGPPAQQYSNKGYEAYNHYDPNQVEFYQPEELPPKVAPLDYSQQQQQYGQEQIQYGPDGQPLPEIAQWVDQVNQSNPALPYDPNYDASYNPNVYQYDNQPHTEPPSPEKMDMQPPLHISKSVPDVLEDEKRRHRHKHRHRSSSVGSRKTSRSRHTSVYTSDSDGSDDDRRRRSRRHRSHSREKYSDSDTGYSRSDRDGHRHHRHRHHRSNDRDRDRERSEKKHRRLRDVKREHRERQEAREGPPPIPPRPGSAATDQSFPPKYSPGPAAGAHGNAAISIPQHIVIPPSAGGKKGDKPQRFHINSEITISYSDRSPSTNPSDSEAALRGQKYYIPPGNGPKIRPITTAPTVQSPTDQEQDDHRVSYGAESSDSKGHGSTAV